MATTDTLFLSNECPIMDIFHSEERLLKTLDLIYAPLWSFKKFSLFKVFDTLLDLLNN